MRSREVLSLGGAIAAATFRRSSQRASMSPTWSAVSMFFSNFATSREIKDTVVHECARLQLRDSKVAEFVI